MNISESQLNLIERVGIDKVKLSGFVVANMDISKLLSLTKKVALQTSANSQRVCKRFIPDTQAGITKITIKDNAVFSDLIIGCADTPGNIHEYVYLTVTVANAKGYNLENMSYMEYTHYIDHVLEYIDSAYGIKLHADYMKADYMEINANIILQYDFSKYSRALKLLMSLFNNHLGKMSTYENMKGKKTSGESFRRGNNSTEIIFYDKVKQLMERNIPVEYDVSILRMELKLKNRKKIDNAFGSCFWKDLDQKKIVGYFNDQIYTQLLKKFTGWQLKKEKELKKLIISCRVESKNAWHHLLMQEIRNKSEEDMIPYILDIQQVCSAFQKIPDRHRNSNRSIKSLLNISIEDDLYKNNDIGKVFEILESLKGCSETALNACQ